MAFVNVYEILVGWWCLLEWEPELELEPELDGALTVCEAATAATKDERRLRFERSSILAVIWMVGCVALEKWGSDVLLWSDLLAELLLFELELFTGP